MITKKVQMAMPDAIRILLAVFKVITQDLAGIRTAVRD
jgi:hypothetical protein